jgi:hypothetical protein
MMQMIATRVKDVLGREVDLIYIDAVGHDARFGVAPPGTIKIKTDGRCDAPANFPVVCVPLRLATDFKAVQAAVAGVMGIVLADVPQPEWLVLYQQLLDAHRKSNPDAPQWSAYRPRKSWQGRG